MAAGEEALLGLYVGKINEQDEHDFVVPSETGDRPLALSESRWHGFLESGERRRKLKADEVSYLWDQLIELFTRHYMAGTSHHLTEVESIHYNFEKVLDSSPVRIAPDGASSPMRSSICNERRRRISDACASFRRCVRETPTGRSYFSRFQRT
jgi:hypothetical protein